MTVPIMMLRARLRCLKAAPSHSCTVRVRYCGFPADFVVIKK